MVPYPVVTVASSPPAFNVAVAVSPSGTPGCSSAARRLDLVARAVVGDTVAGRPSSSRRSGLAGVGVVITVLLPLAS